ncbi:zinc finger BED domain-containing protein RICESLEEPER 2-like protein [Tanacetum coccineum]
MATGFWKIDNGDADPMNIDDESDDLVEEIGKPTQSEGVASTSRPKKRKRKLISEIKGAASEGGRGPYVWDVFCLSNPGRIVGGDNGNNAVYAYYKTKRLDASEWQSPTQILTKKENPVRLEPETSW